MGSEMCIRDSFDRLVTVVLNFFLARASSCVAEELELEGEACWSSRSMGRELVPGSVSAFRFRDMVSRVTGSLGYY